MANIAHRLDSGPFLPHTAIKRCAIDRDTQGKIRIVYGYGSFTGQAKCIRRVPILVRENEIIADTGEETCRIESVVPGARHRKPSRIKTLSQLRNRLIEISRLASVMIA